MGKLNRAKKKNKILRATLFLPRREYTFIRGEKLQNPTPILPAAPGFPENVTCGKYPRVTANAPRWSAIMSRSHAIPGEVFVHFVN